MDNYFQLPHVSNSDLTKIKLETGCRNLYDPVEAWSFGSLIDAMITEPDRVDWWRKLLDGKLIYENEAKSKSDFDKAKMMHKNFFADKTASALIKGASFQKVTLRRREFEVLGVKFELDCRCKWDFFGHISGDIKSTMATSQAQFMAACHYFDYFRGRAWYMDLEDTNKDILIGISKQNFKIFYVPIKRGDELYQQGRIDYENLALKYYVLKT